MKKEPSLVDDFHSMIKTLSRKKEESINDLEEFKKKLTIKINAQLDKLYWKKNAVQEVKSKKQELRKLKIGVWKKLIHNSFWSTVKFVFSMPFIYLMILPGILMHLCLEIYQQVCFRIYRIPRVRPRDFFIFDRRHLPQLNWLEKFNCFYCSYYNCLVSYMQEIVGRTERYWCPIKHAKRMENTHKHYGRFVDYADAKHLREDWATLRKFDEFKK